MPLVFKYHSFFLKSYVDPVEVEKRKEKYSENTVGLQIGRRKLDFQDFSNFHGVDRGILWAYRVLPRGNVPEEKSFS